MSTLTCPGCQELLDHAFNWRPSCGKWLRLTGPTASELHYRRKALLQRKALMQAAQLREDAPPTKGMED